jgi:uncharacterized protein (TIGR00106 family)
MACLFSFSWLSQIIDGVVCCLKIPLYSPAPFLENLSAKMSVICEFSIFPIGQGESLSAYVSPVIELVRKSGFPYQLTAMGTVFETEGVIDALELVDKAYKLLDQAGCSRIYATVKLDLRKGKGGRLSSKVNAVKSQIGDIAT